MTVFTTSIQNRYDGNGSTDAFPYTYKTPIAAGLSVILADADDNQTPLVLDTEYTVDGVGDAAGGNVNTNDLTAITGSVKLPNGWSITITLALDETQGTDFFNQGGFFPETHEDAFDKVTRLVQQLQEQLYRCPKTSITSGEAGDTYLATIQAAVVAAEAAQAAAEVAQAAAEVAQTAAELAETNAETAESNAAASAIAAAASETAAGIAQTAAELAETNAETAQTAAELAQTNAETAQTAAELAETNAETAQTAAETAQTAAELAQTNAETAQTAAEVAQTAAELAETNASNSAIAAAASAVEAANQAASLTGTSGSSILIGLGAKAFNTQADKQFDTGRYLLITSTADPTNYLFGQVTSYVGTGVNIDIQAIGGSGTFSSWDVSLSGVQGATGATGAAGSIQITDAAGTVDVITANYTPDLTLTDKVMAAFVATGANTITNPTFAPDGLTAHNIVKMGGQVLSPGDIPAAGFVALVEYNLANTRWELLNPAQAYIPALRVGSGMPYATIGAAMADVAAGGTIEVYEGTYAEKVTFLQDNITLKAIGSAENTIISGLANDKSVDFGVMSGCTIDRFTVNQTVQNAVTDAIIHSMNDSVSDYNSVINCIISKTVDDGTGWEGVWFQDGNGLLRNCRIIFNNTSATASTGECVRTVSGADHDYIFENNTITFAGSGATAGIVCFALYSTGMTQLNNNNIEGSGAGATVSEVMGISTSGAGTIYVNGNVFKISNASTGLVSGVKVGATSTVYLNGNTIDASNGDSDAKWLNNAGTVYASGNIVKGDGGFTEGTFYGDYLAPGGEILKPSQPSVNVQHNAAQSNIAINTPVTILFDTENKDVGNNFASNIFTASVDGDYQANLVISLINVDQAADSYTISFVSSNRTYNFIYDPGQFAGDVTAWGISLSQSIDMDEGDTLYCTVTQTAGTAQTDLSTLTVSRLTIKLLG